MLQIKKVRCSWINICQQICALSFESYRSYVWCCMGGGGGVMMMMDMSLLPVFKTWEPWCCIIVELYSMSYFYESWFHSTVSVIVLLSILEQIRYPTCISLSLTWWRLSWSLAANGAHYVKRADGVFTWGGIGGLAPRFCCGAVGRDAAISCNRRMRAALLCSHALNGSRHGNVNKYRGRWVSNTHTHTHTERGSDFILCSATHYSVSSQS